MKQNRAYERSEWGGEQHERCGHREQAPKVVAEHDDSGRDLERDRRAQRDRVTQEES